MSKQSILIEFKTPRSLLHAAETLRDAGYMYYESYSPFPVHGMDDAMGLKPSKLGWIVLVGGAVGLFSGLALQIWASAISYPITYSGKPYISLPSFVPVAFELTILFAAFATVFGMLALNKLPRLYHGLFKETSFNHASSHGFFITVDVNDPKYDDGKTRAIMESVGGICVSEVHD